MKRWMVLLALPLLAVASVREDYARQWPLALSAADAGAYRVVLQPQMYRTMRSAELRDVDVVDARGTPVAADVFAPDAPLAAPATRVAVPWFALQDARTEDGGTLALIAQRDASGRILSLQAQAAEGAAQDGARAFVFDLSHVKQAIAVLELALRPDAQVDNAFRVEASDDLEQWRTLAPRAQVLSLQREGKRLAKTDIAVGTQVRYVRLVPLDAAPALPLADVAARLDAPKTDAPLQWETLQASATRDATQFEFDLVGRFPIASVDVRSAGNAAIEWRLESRDDDERPWIARAGPWTAFRVGDTASKPVDIDGAPVRDRHWRLVAQSGRPTETPTLRLGYRPEVVVFLAQGTAPYALVAGSANARRADAPLPRMVEAMRSERGATWMPSPATPGAVVTLGGDAALERRMTPQDWKQVVLWSVLVIGALVVAGFALSLLRKPAN